MAHRPPPAPAATSMRIADILFSQGFGTRRGCADLLASGCVRVSNRLVTDPDQAFPTDGLVFEVGDVAWPFHARALVMLHKPVDTECSQRPGRYQSVLNLLPAPLRTRGVQPVGRLDADTTGLLLFTDDGPLLHRLTSPRHHVPKVYRVTTADPVSPSQIERLRAGVLLHGDNVPAVAHACEAQDAHTLRLTLTEGRYHQVKRMLAAVGNRVTALHRERFGRLFLPSELLPGQWQWVSLSDFF